MARHGMIADAYIDDNWQYICYRGAVTSAIRGKRGQKFLRELIDALDAMPEKKLIKGDLANASGEVCAIGCVGAARGLDVASMDPYDYDELAKVFGISEKLVREIEFENDENSGFGWTVVTNPETGHPEHKRLTPEEQDAQRWEDMRNWAEAHLVKE